MNGKSLSALLERVHLGGLINEAVLTVQDNVGSIQAVDLTNSVFVACSAEVEMEDNELGLGNVGLMAKFLGEEGEVNVTLAEKFATLKRRGHGQVRIQLIVPDEVPTAVVKEGAVKGLLGACSAAFPLAQEAVERLSYYVGLTGGDTIVFTIGKNGKVSVSSDEKEANQFEFPFGKADPAPKEDLKVVVFGKYAAQVFKVLEWVEGETTPSAHVGPGVPLCITQGDDSFWAITPIAS